MSALTRVIISAIVLLAAIVLGLYWARTDGVHATLIDVRVSELG